MCAARELEDGTYSLEDVLDMALRIIWKGKQMEKAQKAKEAQAEQPQQWT